MKTILMTVIKKNDRVVTWVIAVGTPWATDDAYYAMKDTGQFDFVSIPAMTKAPEGQGVYINGRNRNGVIFEDIIGWWFLELPEHFGVKTVIAERSKGKATFWQMVMLDLSASKSGGLKYYLFDHTKIQPDWPHSGGCDFATTSLTGSGEGRDKFSMCLGGKTPYNQVVVDGGVIEQCSQAQAEEYMENAPKGHLQWRNGMFEGDGAGEQFFISFYRRNPGLKWTMQKTGGRAKHWRQERELGPYLENAVILISDASTPYLDALRKALDDFPDGNNDIRDGLYWLMRAFPEVMVGFNRSQDIEEQLAVGSLWTPWSGFRPKEQQRGR